MLECWRGPLQMLSSPTDDFASDRRLTTRGSSSDSGCAAAPASQRRRARRGGPVRASRSLTASLAQRGPSQLETRLVRSWQKQARLPTVRLPVPVARRVGIVSGMTWLVPRILHQPPRSLCMSGRPCGFRCSLLRTGGDADVQVMTDRGRLISNGHRWGFSQLQLQLHLHLRSSSLATRRLPRGQCRSTVSCEGAARV